MPRRCALSLFVVLLLCDLAMPLSPGVFRFDADKTVEIAHHGAPGAAALGVPLASAQRPPRGISGLAFRIPSRSRIAPIGPRPLDRVVPLQMFRPEPEPAVPEDH
jgi:hypothetical protein